MVDVIEVACICLCVVSGVFVGLQCLSDRRGVPRCCGGLFLGLLDKGVRTLIVNGAMCLCHFVAWCAIGVLEFERPKDVCFFFCGYPCIGHI